MKARNQTFFASSFRKTDLPNMKENPGERTEFFLPKGMVICCLVYNAGEGMGRWIGWVQPVEKTRSSWTCTSRIVSTLTLECGF